MSVAGAARGLGVAPGTLRSWERRYGLGPSTHTAGGHRRYGPEDLARLGIMHRLLQEGVPPAEAAAVAVEAAIRPEDVDTTSPTTALFGRPGERAKPPEPSEATGPGRNTGGGRVLAVPGQPPKVRGLARAAMALDVATCLRTLRASLEQDGAERTWFEQVRPVMAAIGRRWERTNRGVEIEHSFSAAVLEVFAAHTSRCDVPANGRPVLLASVPDDLHDLPLVALRAALAEVGIRSHLMGARTPEPALADAIRKLGPPVVFLWAQLPTGPGIALPAVRPAPAIVVGGPGWHDVPPGALLADDLPQAVGAVRQLMGR